MNTTVTPSDLPFVAAAEHGMQPVFIPAACGVSVLEGSRGVLLYLPPAVLRSIAEQVLGSISDRTEPSNN